MASQIMQAVAGNPLDRGGLCLLSLDGGGVRGLSTLLILQAMMAEINSERIKIGEPQVKPCEVFDMIGGTSTGGIIAIMLGRLEMSVDECITTYNRMFETVFSKKGLPVNILGQVKGRFDSMVLEECIVNILKERGLPADEPFSNDKGCRVIVCAKAAEISTTVLFRSYLSSSTLSNLPPTICAAVRATSAATGFFEPVTIPPHNRKFVDGALGANNPIDQIWNEAQKVWCTGDSELQDILKCMVSIGTGYPGLRPIATSVPKIFSDTLVRIVTDTEETAKLFIARHRRLYERKRYFRFNVQQGLQDVGLEEYKKAALIDAATDEYMGMQETQLALRECAINLKLKQQRFTASIEFILKSQQDLRNVPKAPVFFTVVPLPRNVNFIRRPSVFEKLNTLLPGNSSFHMAAIYGLGGSGKTQVALEYAYNRQIETACSLFFVHASNIARFHESYSNIARVAGLSPALKGDDLLFAVRQWIENQGKWLLVLDNASDPKIFKSSYNQYTDDQTPPELLRFVPNRGGGIVIWTSSDGSILGRIVGANQGIEVGSMEDEEATKLLQNLSGRVQNNDPLDEEKRLVNLLDKLPLAITQAAAYIRKTKVSIRQYISMVTESENRLSELLSQEFDDLFRSEVPNSVMNTWHISMKKLSRESECGKIIMNTISFLDNQGIPFELLRAAVPSFSENEILLAAGRLTEYAFLQVHNVDREGLPAYEQHQLVQLVTRQSLSKEDLRLFSTKALAIISDVFPDGGYQTWTDCRVYLPHALKALLKAEPKDNIDRALSLMTRIARFYDEQFNTTEAEKFRIEVLNLRKQEYGQHHQETTQAAADLAATWFHQGRWSEAEKLQMEVLELRKRVLGEIHPKSIEAMADLAATWTEQGRWNEAEELLKRILKLHETIYGEGHPTAIQTMSNLAALWHSQGRLEEAEKAQVQLLEWHKSEHGESHFATLTAMNNLATTWFHQDKLNEAEKLQANLVELQKVKLGERNPSTLRSMTVLAVIWTKQGRLKEAEELEVEVTNCLKRESGERHPVTLLAMANLAGTWRRQRRLNEAEQLYLEVLRLRKSVLGENHPQTILTMANITGVWLQQGRVHEAIRFAGEAAELEKTMPKRDSPTASELWQAWKAYGGKQNSM